MASIISAGTTDSTSLNVSGDKSGILQLASNNAVTAVTIDASQNVGIGTASPSYKLDVQGTTANQRISSTTGTNAAYQIFSNTGQNFYVGLDNSAGNQILSAAYGATLLGSGTYPMVFGTNNTERMRIDSVGNVGIGTNSPSYKLSVTATNTSGDSGAIQVTSPSTDGTQFRLNNTGSGGHSYTFYSTGSGNSIGAGALGIYDQTANAYRTVIDSSGNTMFRTKKVGMGTQTGNSKEVQTISWSGTVTNGTTDLLTTVNFGENGHAGMFLLNMMTAGKGVSRIYFLTGRYSACILTMYQGGNRGAGEDAYLQLTGGSNTIGLQLVTSGWAGATYYYVVGFLGISTVYYDNWFSN